MQFDCLFPGRTMTFGGAPIRKQLALPIHVKDGTAIGSQSRCVSCEHSHILRGYRESEEGYVLLLRKPDGGSLQGTRVLELLGQNAA